MLMGNQHYFPRKVAQPRTKAFIGCAIYSIVIIGCCQYEILALPIWFFGKCSFQLTGADS